jgi:hypothetical protein
VPVILSVEQTEAAPSCSPTPFNVARGIITWPHPVKPGESVTVTADKVGELFADHEPIRVIEIIPPGVVATNYPTRQNGCRPLVLRNDSPETVDRITIRWQRDR